MTHDTRSRTSPGLWKIMLVGAVVFAAVSWWQRGRETQAVEAIVAETTGREGARVDGPPTAARISEMLRQLALVTVRIESQVEALAADQSWRGRVDARVSAAATTLMGVELSGLQPEDIEIDPLTGRISLRLPAPVRLATEIITPADQQSINVDVGWARLRDVAGEYYLGQARARLHEAARAQLLTPDQRRRIDELSREQVERLLRLILGGRAEGREITIDFVQPIDAERGAAPERDTESAP